MILWSRRSETMFRHLKFLQLQRPGLLQGKNRNFVVYSVSRRKDSIPDHLFLNTLRLLVQHFYMAADVFILFSQNSIVSTIFSPITMTKNDAKFSFYFWKICCLLISFRKRKIEWNRFQDQKRLKTPNTVFRIFIRSLSFLDKFCLKSHEDKFQSIWKSYRIF